MLWTLYSRAREAMRSDTPYPDPKAVEIYRALDYNFRRSFGPANPMAALRARVFDESVRRFLQRFPGSSVVNLGEGLETQRYRLALGDCQWFTVDLPEAIAVRERFITPDSRHRHVALSASDTRWFDEIPQDKPVLIAAQGLFMYFDGAAVQDILGQIGARFPVCQLVFDSVPRWVSRLSVVAGGLPLTPFYRTPAMPWGISRFQVRPCMRRWLARPHSLQLLDYPAFPRGPSRVASTVLPQLPGARQWTPTIVEASWG